MNDVRCHSFGIAGSTRRNAAWLLASASMFCGLGMAAPTAARAADPQPAADTQASAVPNPGALTAPAHARPIVIADAARVQTTHTPLIKQSSRTPFAPSGGGDTSEPVPAGSYLTPTEIKRIDSLRIRDDLIRPSVTNTVLGDIGGFRSTLADYGFGFQGYIVGNFSANILNEPHKDAGVRRYVGQSPEWDSDTNYLALNYDAGRIGLKGGLFTFRACLAASDEGTYAHGIRLCSAYLDQPLFNHHVEIQAGILTNHYQYVNPLVGGSDSTGSLGPDANLFTELGEGTGGAGNWGVNVRFSQGSWYDKMGVAKANDPGGTIPEEQVANPYGIRFNGIGSSALVLNEVGYQHLPTPGTKSTWVRLTYIKNFSEYAAYDNVHKERPQGVYALGDQQILQISRRAPRRGLYVGGSFMYATPTVFAYDKYLEARIYGIGLIPARPRDLMSFVVNDTFVSVDDRRQLVAKKEMARSSLAGFTIAYTANLFRGVFLNGGLSYDVHPSIIYDNAQGNPLLARVILVLDL